jgi:hypothetical protein
MACVSVARAANKPATRVAVEEDMDVEDDDDEDDEDALEDPEVIVAAKRYMRRVV